MVEEEEEPELGDGQPSYAMWLPLWSSSSSPSFLGRRTRVGGHPWVVDHLVVLRSGGT